MLDIKNMASAIYADTRTVASKPVYMVMLQNGLYANLGNKRGRFMSSGAAKSAVRWHVRNNLRRLPETLQKKEELKQKYGITSPYGHVPEFNEWKQNTEDEIVEYLLNNGIFRIVKV